MDLEGRPGRYAPRISGRDVVTFELPGVRGKPHLVRSVPDPGGQEVREAVRGMAPGLSPE